MFVSSIVGKQLHVNFLHNLLYNAKFTPKSNLLHVCGLSVKGYFRYSVSIFVSIFRSILYFVGHRPFCLAGWTLRVCWSLSWQGPTSCTGTSTPTTCTSQSGTVTTEALILMIFYVYIIWFASLRILLIYLYGLQSSINYSISKHQVEHPSENPIVFLWLNTKYNLSSVFISVTFCLIYRHISVKKNWNIYWSGKNLDFFYDNSCSCYWFFITLISK